MSILDNLEVKRGSAFCVVEVLMNNGETQYLLVQECHKQGRKDKWKCPGGRFNKQENLDRMHGFRGTALREIREELDREGFIDFTIEDIGESVYEVLKDPDGESHAFVVFRVQITEDDLDKITVFEKEIAMADTFRADKVQRMVAHTANHPPHGDIVKHHALALRADLSERDPWDDVAVAYAS